MIYYRRISIGVDIYLSRGVACVFLVFPNPYSVFCQNDQKLSNSCSSYSLIDWILVIKLVTQIPISESNQLSPSSLKTLKYSWIISWQFSLKSWICSTIVSHTTAAIYNMNYSRISAIKYFNLNGYLSFHLFCGSWISIYILGWCVLLSWIFWVIVLTWGQVFLFLYIRHKNRKSSSQKTTNP